MGCQKSEVGMRNVWNLEVGMRKEVKDEGRKGEKLRKEEGEKKSMKGDGRGKIFFNH